MRTRAAICGLVVVSGAALSDWPVGPGGNPARDCLSSGVGPNAAEILWNGVSVSDILETQPVISDGVVFTGRIINFTIPTGSRIVAQDLETGAELWSLQLPYDDRADDPDFEGEWRGRVSAARDGRVYATRSGNTRSAPMYALDGLTGDVVWISEDLVTAGSTEGNVFAPNGDLIVGSQVAGANNQIPGNVLRIDHETGDTVWKTNRSCPTTNGCLVNVFGNKVYLFEAGPRLTALDLETGAFLYTGDVNQLGGGAIQQLGMFIGPDGTIYAPRGQQGQPGELQQEFDTFFAIRDTGAAFETLWALPAGFTPFATAGVGPDGSVYAYRTPENDQGQLLGDLIVLRLNPADGAILNQSAPIPCSTVAPSPRMAIDRNGDIYLTTNAGLFALSPDLTERYHDDTLNDASGPALADGILIINGGGTDMRAYQTPCPADLDGDNDTDADDFFAYLDAFAAGDLDVCDIDEDGDCDADDFFGYLDLFAQGC